MKQEGAVERPPELRAPGAVAGFTDQGEQTPPDEHEAWLQRYSKFFSPYILDAPDPRERLEKVVRFGAILFIAGGVLAFMVTTLPGSTSYANARAIAVLGFLALVGGMVMFGLSKFVTPLVLYALLFLAIVAITLAVYFSGRFSLGFACMMYTWHSSLSFTVLKKRWVVPPLVAMGIGLAVVFWTYVSNEVPAALAVNGWFFTIGTVLVIGTFVSLLVQNVHETAVAERKSRTEAEAARTELFLLNRDLEDRVKAKVLEVERLSALRRLVSSNVAEALLGEGKALDPHRREIACVFLDLRGFTKFATECDPEEVIQVLDEFYLVLGRAFNDYEATVGAFEADGVMAYFNDPTPVENPAQRAVEMALALCAPMNNLVERWQTRGFDLHFGVGIALGYATMGMVGFEGRQDYTAIGPVVNLAARLCAESKRGDILIDRKVRLAISQTIEVENLEPRELKGFREPVPVFRIVSGGISL